MRGVISFDIDGVLANFIRGFTRVGNSLHGTPIGDESSHQAWNFEDFPELQLTKPLVKAMWAGVWADPNFWANLDPMNVSVIREINDIRNKVFITNRAGVEPAKQSERFLEKWGVWRPEVYLAADKAPLAKKLNVVAVIDDYVVNCRDLKVAIPEAYIAMLWTPYNQPYHIEMKELGVDIVLSVEQFIGEACRRGLIEY